jgi:hypothetical protein
MTRRGSRAVAFALALALLLMAPTPALAQSYYCEGEATDTDKEPGVALYVIMSPVFIAFGALFGVVGSLGLWFGLLFVVPGLLYRFSGPFKWTFDRIRSFLHRIIFGRPEDNDEGCLSTIGQCGACMAFTAYFIISIVLLVHSVNFLTDPRFDKIRSYDDAVDKWQGGLAKEYESAWTSRQLPTLHLEQDFNDDNQITPLAFDPTFQLETSKTHEESLPQLQPEKDMQQYEEKVMVAAKVENFHVPSIHPSESGKALTVRIGEQNFTFAPVHQWKDTGVGTLDPICHYAAYLNGLMFVFNEEVQKHACTPLYYNPALTCHDEWPSLYPPANLTLRVEIRSPHDPSIVASELLGCPTTRHGYEWGGATMRERWNLIIIFAYVVVCSGLAIFLFSKPGWLWEMLEWDKKNKTDVEAGNTETTNPQQSGGWFSFKMTAFSRQPKIIR